LIYRHLGDTKRVLVEPYLELRQQLLPHLHQCALVQRNAIGIQGGRGRQMLEPALHLQLVLELEGYAALGQCPQLCPLLLLLRQIVENTEAGTDELPIGLNPGARTKHLHNRPVRR